MGSGRVFVAAVLAGGLVFGAAAGAFAQQVKRIPSGHAYSPTEKRLPRLNSRRDKINARADIRQTEIYRSQRDAAETFSQMGLYGGNRFAPAGAQRRPRY